MNRTSMGVLRLFSWFEPAEESGWALAGSNRASSQASFLWVALPVRDSEQTRKRFGRLYTSDVIVSSMLDRIGFSGQAILGSRIIDPDVEAGAFAIESTRHRVDGRVSP